MAKIMIVQGSGRKRGFTATLMHDIADEIGKVAGIEVEIYHLHNYSFGPCKSCFFCIRNVGKGCAQDDDWGKKGQGELFRAFKRANALLMVDPVHGWGASAAARVFIERIYPTFWEGTPYGLPFASVSCASNQGFQTRAVEEFCKFSAAKGFRYIGGLPVHVAYLDEARKDAVALGMKLAEAALADEKNGRKKLSDEEIFLMYKDTPWSIVHGYIENLTDATYRYETSVPARALANGSFTNPEAHPLLEKACASFKTALAHYDAGDTRAAAVELAKTSKFWTNATYIQFLREDVIRADMPKAYRPLDEL